MAMCCTLSIVATARASPIATPLASTRPRSRVTRRNQLCTFVIVVKGPWPSSVWLSHMRSPCRACSKSSRCSRSGRTRRRPRTKHATTAWPTLSQRNQVLRMPRRRCSPNRSGAVLTPSTRRTLAKAAVRPARKSSQVVGVPRWEARPPLAGVDVECRLPVVRWVTLNDRSAAVATLLVSWVASLSDQRLLILHTCRGRCR